jgi:hypothetical protein
MTQGNMCTEPSRASGLKLEWETPELSPGGVRIAARADSDQLFAWYGQGLPNPAIGRRLSSADAPEAVRTVAERRSMGQS